VTTRIGTVHSMYRDRNGPNSNPLVSNDWRKSLVPAPAVIPAPIVYIKVVAVKKLVVRFQGGARRVSHNSSSARGDAWRPATQASSSSCHEGPVCRMSTSRGGAVTTVTSLPGGTSRAVIDEGIQGGVYLPQDALRGLARGAPPLGELSL